MLKIGMSACFMYADPNREVFGQKNLLYMGHDMSHYLGLSGIMPILIPDLPDDKLFEDFIDQLDGIIFQGGIDITPQLYGEYPLDDDHRGDPQRDVYEMKILDLAIKRKMPVLGICRGFQLINVYFGGSLYQDIETQSESKTKHYDEEIYDELVHKVEFSKGGLFEKLHGGQKHMFVNSVHHQGIKKLGNNLEVEAVSPEDQMIEAFRWSGSEEKGLVTGIQWHPEFFHTMQADVIESKPLLSHFINQSKKFNKKKSV